MQNIQVNLAFTADAHKARTELNQLLQSLNKIATQPVNIGDKLTSEIQSASHAAAELQAHLQQAMNTKTGTLDFGKLNSSIKQSGMSLSEYGAKLQAIGPQGQQAFMSLAHSVAAAEVPMRRANGALAGMFMTLKNTAKWQLSSSLLHGFIGSVQSAYNYAQDLNESLNNIRIVTGQNIDQMAKFAAEANKAAKALSTTTTEYTNASLIYYQQGLNDAEVKARTDVTIKMANASRQSAEIVSDQLTAIWNNFDDGTKSLEYYADALTALGAATASSTDEISQGLEKFAAVADTVGLSYKYATAALATVTATTRQSADVVGTAFKTLFARLNDLKLGETLDDGTTLGQYTENLAKIGVNIKTASGGLKDMDVILEETAAKWQLLDRDQQTALAKGVAGIRQYSQFIALMDNWDFMKENLATVEASGGILQEQADIYAESWDAAQKRVQASAEKLYSTLLDDKFFINLTNSFGGLIDTVGEFLDSIGGLGGILSGLGFIITKVFAQQMATGFRNLVYNIQMSTKAGQFAVQQAKELEMTNFAAMMAKSEASTAAELQTKKVYEQELILQRDLISNAHNLTEEEQKKYQLLLEQYRTMGQQSIELQKQVELAKDKAAQSSTEVIGTGMLNGSTFKQMFASMGNLKTSAAGMADIQQQLTLIGTKGKASAKQIDHLKTILKSVGMTDKGIDELAIDFANLQSKGEKASISMEKIKAIVSNINKTQIKHVINAAGIREGTKEYERLEQELQNYAHNIGEAHIKEQQLNNSNKNLKASFKSLKQGLQDAGVQVQDWATHLSTAMSGLMSAGMLISSINGLTNTLKDPDASGWEKFGSILTSVSMIAMSFTGVWKGLTSVIEFGRNVLNKETAAKILNTLASYLQEKQSRATAKQKSKEAVSTKASAEAIEDETEEKIKNAAVDKVTNKNGLSSGTYKSGSKAGQTWYKQNGKFISADKYASLGGKTAGAGGKVAATGGKAAGALNAGTLSTLGGAAVAVAAIAAAVVLVGGTIAWANYQAKAAERALEKAKATSKEAQENLDTIKNSYNEFVTTTSNYQSAVDSLKDLTKGTLEYQDAVLKANEEASKLLETNENLKYTIEDGQIKIDKESLEATQRQKQQELENAQVANISAQNNVRTAEENLKKRDMARDLWSNSDAKAGVGNTVVAGVAGVAAGALVGSVIPVIGTAVGAIVGGAIGLIGGAISNAVIGVSNTAENEALEKLEKAYLEDSSVLQKLKDGSLTDSDWEKIGIDDQSLRDALLANADKVSELVKEMGANTQAINAQNDIVASTILSDNERVQTSDYADQIIDVTGDIYGLAYDKALESDWMDTWGKEGIAQINGANAEAKKVFEEYLKYAGLEGQGYELTDTTGNDDNRKFVYKDKEGNEKEVSLETMQAARAAYEASQTLDKAASALADTFDRLATSANSADQSLLSFLAYKNFAETSESELNDLYTQVANSQGEMGGEISEADVSMYLDKQFGDGLDGAISDETAQQYGYETADAMVKAFYNKLQDTKDEWDSITLPPDLINVDQVNLSLAKKINEVYDQISSGPKGEAAGQEFIAGINDMLSSADLTDEEIQQALQDLMTVNWASWDAMDEVQNKLETYGVTIDTTSDKWSIYADSIRKATGAGEDFAATGQKINKVLKTLKEIEAGDIISKEQYDEIVRNNSGLKKYFLATDDEGNQMYTGTQDIVPELQQAEINNFLKAKQTSDTLEKIGGNVKTTEEIARERAGDADNDLNYYFQDNEAAQKAIGAIYRNRVNTGPIANGKMTTADTIYMSSDGSVSVVGTNGHAEGREIAWSAEEADKAVTNYALAQELDSLLKNAPELRTFLMDKGYSKEQINYAIQDGRKGEDNNLTAILTALRNQYNPSNVKDLDNLQDKVLTKITSFSDLQEANTLGVLDLQNEEDRQKYDNIINTLSKSKFEAAQTLEDIQGIIGQILDADGEVNYQYYSEALMRLGEQYGNCAQEVEAFHSALVNGNVVAIAAAQEDLEISIMLGEAAEKYGTTAEEMEIQMQHLQKEYTLSSKEAARLAIQNQRMNQGIKSLTENWQDWYKELKASNKTTTDYAKAAHEVTKVIADLIGASEDLELPATFLESDENLRLIGQAASGDTKAIQQLGMAIAKLSIDAMSLDVAVTKTLQDGITSTFTPEQFNAAKATVLAGITELEAKIAQGSVAVGAEITSMGNDWITALNEMALATNMSVEDMNGLLSELGVQTEVKTVEITVPRKVPEYTTTTTIEDWDERSGMPTLYTTSTAQTGVTTMDETISVAQIGTEDSTEVPKVTYLGRASVSDSALQSGNGGGGGKTSKPKKTDTVERYKEITDKLDDNTDAMNEASKAADRLYGPARIKAMQTVNELLQDEIDLLKDKKDEANLYLPQDKTELENALAEVTTFSNEKVFQFDENGNISNYTDIMSALWDEYNAFYKKVTKDGRTPSDAQQEKLDRMQAELDLIKERKEAYEETRELIEDIDQSILDKFYEWQDNNYEILNSKIELQIEINDAALTKLEYYLSKIEDDFYSMAEAAAMLIENSIDKTGKIITRNKLDIYKSNLASGQQKYDDLIANFKPDANSGVTVEDVEEAIETNDFSVFSQISDANFAEGMRATADMLYENLTNLQELDKTMTSYYSETLAAASEELTKYTDLMEHSASVLEHYKSISEMMGKSTNYEWIGTILKGQETVAKDRFAVSKANYEMLARQVTESKDAYENAYNKAAAEGREDDAGLKVFEDEWHAAQVAANEAQDQMLADAEAWGESSKAVLENALAGFAQALENTLTDGFGSFEEMNNAFERKNSLQEEYLTTTNKIYETNKMMRTAQQEIDKTTNAAAKARLKQFINETYALQDQTQLSQYELDIQQAKYDLLLAEIALEEAQNAKSTVRLQRDSEGNFSYVYTANQDKIAEAQQKFEDAENALYNKGLEGANDYVQKYQETMQEMYDTLQDIQSKYQEGVYESEAEYEQAIMDAKEYYYTKLEQYSNLYQVALSTDVKVASDAWTTEFGAMTQKTGDWKTAVETYLGDEKTGVRGAFKTFESEMNSIANETTGKDLDTLANGVGDVTSKTKDLLKILVGEDGKSGVINALEKQLNGVKEVTSGYTALRDELLKDIETYESLASAAGAAADAMASTNTGGSSTGTNSAPKPEPETKPKETKDTKTDSTTGSTTTADNSSSGKTYTVKAGDTLSKIAQRNNMSLSELLAKNPQIKNKDLIYVGDVVKLDSGGYTGDWGGSYGKLAMLHKKELVLNPEDTINFLASMEVLEHILQIIDLQAASAQIGGILTTPHLQNTNRESLEQNVHIEAHFPNATDHNEIELAFDSLINQATQYANRK